MSYLQLYKGLFLITFLSCTSATHHSSNYVNRFYNYQYMGSKKGFKACEEVKTNLKGTAASQIDELLFSHFKTFNSTINEKDCKRLKNSLEMICKQKPNNCPYSKRFSKK